MEAQPDHCKLANEHIVYNKANPEAQLICAAVGAEDGTVEFPVDEDNNAAKGNGKFGYGVQMVLDGKRYATPKP